MLRRRSNLIILACSLCTSGFSPAPRKKCLYKQIRPRRSLVKDVFHIMSAQIVRCEMTIASISSQRKYRAPPLAFIFNVCVCVDQLRVRLYDCCIFYILDRPRGELPHTSAHTPKQQRCGADESGIFRFHPVVIRVRIRPSFVDGKFSLDSQAWLFLFYACVFFCADRRAKDAEPASALGEMNDYLRPRGFALVPLLN
jgi:hypothetical protein